MFQSLVPLPIIYLPIVPCVDSFPVSLSILKESEIRVVVGVPFETPAIPHVIFPFALVLPTVLVPHYAFAVPFAVRNGYLSHVQSLVIVSLLLVVRQLTQGSKVELRSFKHDVLKLGHGRIISQEMGWLGLLLWI